jgi:hypothetical protein
LSGLLPSRTGAGDRARAANRPLPWLQITSDGASSHALLPSSLLQEGKNKIKEWDEKRETQKQAFDDRNVGILACV